MSEPNETQGQPDPLLDPEATASFGPRDSASELVRVLDGYMADLQAGRAPDRDRLLADHPDLAAQLEQCLAGIEFVHRAAGPDPAESARLGEFQIIREIGRGGMGVVYEAEQTSLKRRVALKVLRFGVVADADAMRRFQREAETVARLHHTNIVPIFAVGSERSVHYYAMQFIDGRSLADVLNDSRAEGRPIPAEDVARWGLQAAEALDHAHRRGVIHRDIKPSNLLLDPEGIVWLTDFGLAKRADEVTMTVSGAVMGTPRYMSPEQATVLNRPIDHRTDIYSLGASLYELATGRPLFDAQTAHGVISQILNNEPTAPRQVRPSLHRDLETIVLKCLAKEPDRRYPDVRALADDLRAFLEGRAIKARRPSPAERAARWARKQRRSAALAAISAAASVLLVVGSIVAWMAYSRSQLGSIVLTTDDPGLTAEVHDDAEDDVVTPSFSLPTQQPVPLPAGSYRVKVSAAGLLSETYQLLVDRGADRRYQVGLGERRLWEPIKLQPSDTVELVDLAGRTDAIQANGNLLRRIDGASGRPIWEMNLMPVPQGNGVVSPEDQEKFQLLRPVNDSHPLLVRPAPDLDGDGVRDLVWTSRTTSALWAISGKGQELWRFHAATGLAVAEPIAIEIDGDGTPDLVAPFANGAERWVEAVSGKSGRSIWHRALVQFPSPPTGRELAFLAEVVSIGGKPTLVIVACTSLVGLDPRTGRDAWPAVDLGFPTVRAPQVADLDGDGHPEVVVLQQRLPGEEAVKAIALETRRTLWERPTSTRYESGIPQMDPEWPLVADLDGDGKAEVILPAASTPNSLEWSGIEVIDGDGRVRWRRRMNLFPFSGVPQQFVDGPDLDGDGVHELFAASTVGAKPIGNEGVVCVDALSGKDGRLLWWWRRPVPSRNDLSGPLRWWPSKSIARPRLVLPVLTFPSQPIGLFVLATETGRLEHEVTGAFGPIAADLDGDGRADLAYRTGSGSEVIFGGGTLHAARGVPEEPWRRLGLWQPVADLDGDGTADLVGGQDGRAAAISGRDGRPIWRTTGVEAIGDGRVRLLGPPGDLDGDGSADLVAIADNSGRADSDYERIVLPLRAISGKTGRSLWQAPEIRRPGSQQYLFANAQESRGRDLDGDGRPEVLVIFNVIGFSPAPLLSERWIGVLSGRDGRWVWRQRLAEPRPDRPHGDYRELFSTWLLAPPVADLDGDGVKDVALTVPIPLPGNKITAELRALSGRDGTLLWKRPIAPRYDLGDPLENLLPVPVVGDLDGDGKAEVVYLDRVPNVPGEVEVVALGGRDGRPKWTPWRGHPAHRQGPLLREPPDPLLVDLDGKGRRAIALLLASDDLILLDARGQLRRRDTIPATTFFEEERGNRLWAHDLDGDGKEELVYTLPGIEESKVRAVRGDTGAMLWEWSKPGRLAFREIRPAARSHGAFVVLAALGKEVIGLDGATGKPAWRGLGLPGDTSYMFNNLPLFNSDLLDTGDPSGIPRIVGRSWQATVCRLAEPTRPTSGPRAPWPGPARPASDDPRLDRPLPWMWGGLLTQPRLVPSLIFSAGLSLVLIVLPALLIVRAARRRTWSLARMMVVVLALGLLFSLARSVLPDLALPLTDLLSRALIGLPIVGILGLAIVWTSRRRWRLLGLLLGGSIGFGFFYVLLAFALDDGLLGSALKIKTPRIDPSQHYSWDGWYWPVLVGAYAAGGTALVILALRVVFQLAPRRPPPWVRRTGAA